jgi:hypothetical protein
MKSGGEAMAIGRTFKASLQKCLRSLEIGRSGLGGDGKTLPFPPWTNTHSPTKPAARPILPGFRQKPRFAVRSAVWDDLQTAFPTSEI